MTDGGTATAAFALVTAPLTLEAVVTTGVVDPTSGTRVPFTVARVDAANAPVPPSNALETIQGKYSEIAISSPDGLAVCRFIVDPITEKIYSTKADEVEFLRTAEKRGVPLFEAIEQLIARSNGR